ncbi:hypothetical protein B296_00033314 [Ensete ventricosum]|uniref:Uncharacterized protein n=1 Tax=Ensete ventricosum TaxID=4639 RepID=A0A426XT22_ENSVE|nr:hypothetical protein B296_00033314 [Ensete ventricosum]
MLIAASHSFCTGAQQRRLCFLLLLRTRASTDSIAGHNRCPSLISSSASSVAIAASPRPCHPCRGYFFLDSIRDLWLQPAPAQQHHRYLPPVVVVVVLNPLQRPSATRCSQPLPPLLPQQPHITAALPSSTTAVATPSSATTPPAHSPLLSPPAPAVGQRRCLLCSQLQPPLGAPHADATTLSVSDCHRLRRTTAPLTFLPRFLVGPPLPHSLPLPLLPSSPQPRHPFFLPVVQPKAKVAAILPCYHSHL